MAVFIAKRIDFVHLEQKRIENVESLKHVAVIDIRNIDFLRDERSKMAQFRGIFLGPLSGT